MKRVQYVNVGSLRVGEGAFVLPLDHPGPYVNNGHWVFTSAVQRIVLGEKGPTFYTEFTEYRPVDGQDSIFAELVEPKKPLFSGQAVMEMCA